MVNEYSFIMAKQIDITKIEAIKTATIKIVVTHGIAGASISLIAKEAGVSDGYLYRHYSGKRELIADLFTQRFNYIHTLLNTLLEENKTIALVVEQFTRKMYETAIQNSKLISFFYKLLSDFSFEIPEECKQDIQQLCNRIIEMGRTTGEIKTPITAEQFYAITVGGILQFINIRLRGIFSDADFSENDIMATIQFIQKAIQTP